MRLAACAEMLFLELPMKERVSTIAGLGFDVEIWSWADKDLPELARTGAVFSSMTGYLEGDLTTDDGVERLMTTASRALDAAAIIDSPRLNLHGTGLGADGLPTLPSESPTGADWIRAADTLARLAELAAERGRVFTLENLNTAVDHPGTPFARAAETMALVVAVDNPALRLNLDLYHAQIGEGNLIQLMRSAMPWVGEIQVADVPGRHQPGTGEINYPAIAQALTSAGYDGVVALEAWATGDSAEALDQFRAAFSRRAPARAPSLDAALPPDPAKH